MSTALPLLASVAAGLVANRAVDVWLPELTYRMSLLAGVAAGAVVYVFVARAVARLQQKGVAAALAEANATAAHAASQGHAGYPGSGDDALLYDDVPSLPSASSCSVQPIAPVPANTPTCAATAQNVGFSYMFDTDSPAAVTFPAQTSPVILVCKKP